MRGKMETKKVEIPSERNEAESIFGSPDQRVLKLFISYDVIRDKGTSPGWNILPVAREPVDHLDLKELSRVLEQDLTERFGIVQKIILRSFQMMARPV
jgi:hypothetical protein